MAEEGKPRVTVRHYCQGIGDCHLLRFPKDDGGDFWMLIDCGIHTSITGGPEKIDDIVDDIVEAVGAAKHIDVVVGTHEHTDHLSGFLSAADKFKTISFGELWLGWTEDPEDPQALELDKYKDQALAALQESRNSLARASSLSPYLTAVHEGLQSVLGFQFGAKGDKVRAMRDALVELSPKDPKYLEPVAAPILVPGLSNIRIYVLGPPRDPDLIKILNRPSEVYGLGGIEGLATAQALNNGFAVHNNAMNLDDDYAAPFDHSVGTDLTSSIAQAQAAKPEDDLAQFLQDYYTGRVTDPAKTGSKKGAVANQDPSWRRIDSDWLGVSSDLAIQLDKRTNNSSVVLAFEFIDTGRVLLFVGDAQVGNWLSWQDLKWSIDNATVTGPDLLARTVYYKVGHHGSHNATLKQKGLELMTSRDLAAFIPTNEKDAKKVKWGEMPFHEIVEELERRCSGRVVRADDALVDESRPDVAFEPPSGAILALRHKPGLWVEFDLA
jgi:hypothetical protein